MNSLLSVEVRHANETSSPEPDGKKLHPEDNDSGTVALIAIFAASAILVILSVVSDTQLVQQQYTFSIVISAK